jgi:hypothetical protein
MTSSIITKALQAKLSSCGLDWVKLQSLHLDSKAKTIAAELTLEGEESPVTVDLSYSLGAEQTLVIRSVNTNRRWMTEALRMVLARKGDRIPLPGGIQGQLIRVVL